MTVALTIGRSSVPLPLAALTPGEAAIHAGLPGTHARYEWRVGRRALRAARAAAGLGRDTSSVSFPDRSCSLTHTHGGAVAVALPRHAADDRIVGVGVDREVNRSPSPATGRFVLTAAELEWIDHLPRPLVPPALLRLWTVKEALFKSDPANAATVLTDYAVDDPGALSGVARRTDTTQLAFAYRSRCESGSVETIAVARDNRRLAAP